VSFSYLQFKFKLFALILNCPIFRDTYTAGSAATELQSLINNIQSQGWDFVSLSSMQTAVKPTGCNQAQNKGQSSIVNIQLLIFKK
jgi:hypothetical protein